MPFVLTPQRHGTHHRQFRPPVQRLGKQRRTEQVHVRHLPLHERAHLLEAAGESDERPELGEHVCHGASMQRRVDSSMRQQVALEGRRRLRFSPHDRTQHVRELERRRQRVKAGALHRNAQALRHMHVAK